MGTHSEKSQAKVTKIMSGEFPVIKSTGSLVATHVTKERWDKLKNVETKTCGFTLDKACACAIESALLTSTPLTWMSTKLPETLTLLPQFTPPVSVLDVALMDLVFPPELPSSSVLMLRSS